MTTLPPIPSDDDIMTMDVFPYPEGKQFEYKNSLFIVSKILPTICAFLNSEGGYMIFGIDDETLQITGLKATTKDVDVFILENIDKMFHQKMIVNQSDLSGINPRNITARVLWKGPKVIIIISVVPDEGVSYQINDGSVYYRANASNLKVRADRVITEHHMTNLLHTQKKQIMREYDMVIRTMTNESRRTNRYVQQLEKVMKTYGDEKDALVREVVGLRATKDALQLALFEKILADKKDAEKRVLKISLCDIVSNVFYGMF
jgi:hypothetical protein